MATRPFKIVIKDGQHVRQDLTDEEIADAQSRTAQEEQEKATRRAREEKLAAMMAWLEAEYDKAQARR